MNETTLKTQFIGPTITYVKKELTHAEGGHDWWHIQRVWQLARHIASLEKVDMLVVELGALLHDIADSKFHNGDESIGPEKARSFLQSIETPAPVTQHVVNIIRHISFKGGNHRQEFQSPELAVVQDADRLDALGAIGIARTFNYGGFKNRPIYDPAVMPNLQMTKEEYKQSLAPTINHFYEKLLLLKDRMNTPTGKALALERHRFMEQFLQQFYAEWDGRA
ncbi:HD domain-containing protein [Chitinophaga agrisoli]|uniref:HD domain-containing protein n=1 Tax=Chitinophaga agrisoli TaxID=2607653 RepID=A0A5B2VN89_9BACT|nr:HD domain-containing protein [Chitinophaga agrisoli]KAA2240234.1 HD domain-containing protein [Chitinophaga agrisoli]